jgi:hypothetical protein
LEERNRRCFLKMSALGPEEAPSHPPRGTALLAAFWTATQTGWDCNRPRKLALLYTCELHLAHRSGFPGRVSGGDI